MRHSLRFRQVHLDFHTPDSIPGIGSRFDPETFAKTLHDAHVDSITCFSRCHHGWFYYDSKKFPNRVHPELANKDLLKQQIEACHRYGIQVPVYTTVQWDQQIADEHRDWLVENESGAPFGQAVFEPGFYRNLCLNTPYVDYLKEQVADLFDCLGKLDGLFLDILNIKPCCCPRCVAEMQSRGMNAKDETARYEFAQIVMDRFKEDMTHFIHEIQPECPVFYNVGFIGTQHRKALDSFTHLEIESLPGGSWGYDHFPVTARYTRTLGLDFMGMTGKFHTSWGDFHSFKTQAALEYECFKSLAYCGKCSIGDQLHPSGEISKPVYELIGSVYEQVEQKEPWCVDAVPLAEVGILIPEEFCRPGTLLLSPDLIGAVKIFTELGIQFNVIDTKEDFSKYRLLVLPDSIPVEGAFEKKLAEFVKQGNAVLASHRSGLNSAGTAFSQLIPAVYCGDAAYSPDFIVAQGKLGAGLSLANEYVMYDKALEVAPAADASELLKTNTPYFNRTWDHYCSHMHFPSSGNYGYPAALERGKVIYFAHPLFTTYQTYGPNWIKTFVKNAVSALLGTQLVTHNGPSTLEVTLNQQAKEQREILHLLHYLPQRRAEQMDIVEDIIPLYSTKLSVDTQGKTIKAVRLVPQNQPLAFAVENGRVEFTVEKISGHQMLSLEY